MKNLANKTISYLQGKHSIKEMSSEEKLSYFKTFNQEQLNDVLHCIEHIMATNNGKACHLSDF